MPFWRVVSHSNHKGRGVVGVLEANFIEPTHNKQEFEKTSLFQKLEARLKEMTLEYWQYHCGLIGYGQKKSATTEPAPPISEACSGLQPVTIDPNSPAIRSATVASVPPSQLLGRRPGESIDNYQTTSPPGIPKKRKEHGHTVESGLLKRRAGSGENVTNRRHNCEAQPINGTEKRLREKETADLMQDNKKLIAQCLESEKRQEELNLKIEQLRIELLESKHEYERLLRESQSLALSMSIKEETT
ncbi:hypothetical protein GIB67_014072 [Kingdonia uniflora]|uniref:Morc S5 domain-containing protein n=1 Tax=Kingdonia uniflora TaxID=39325 RepID=A0A7J7KXE1_9MAGN|nr:hypothetical protein GIB67_014072 [Kingdonia uniflora]